MATPERKEHLLKVEEIATRLDVTQETVRRWLRQGALRGINLGRKAGWRVRVRDLEAFLDKRTSGNGTS